MDVTISIDGKVQTLSDEQRWGLRQACAIEQHRCLTRRDNTRTKHLQVRFMNQALFLEQLYKDLSDPIGGEQDDTR